MSSSYGIGGSGSMRGMGLPGFGQGVKQEAMAGIQAAAKLETERESRNAQTESERQGGNAKLGATVGAMGGMMVGGPVGAMIGGLVGGLGSRLF